MEIQPPSVKFQTHRLFCNQFVPLKLSCRHVNHNKKLIGGFQPFVLKSSQIGWEIIVMLTKPQTRHVKSNKIIFWGWHNVTTKNVSCKSNSRQNKSRIHRSKKTWGSISNLPKTVTPGMHRHQKKSNKKRQDLKNLKQKCTCPATNLKMFRCKCIQYVL